MYAQPVHPDYLQNTWPVVKDWLEAGLAHGAGEYNVDQLKVMIMRGDNHLVVMLSDSDEPVGACTVAFENFPNARIAFVTSIGGKGLSDLSLLESFSEWCRANGCTSIRGAVRPAVAALVKIFGFEQRYIIVEHQL
jgi:hypothetical protein